MHALSARRRREILDALRRGTVPQDGLDALAVGLDRFGDTMDQEIAKISEGGSGFKAVRGEYGCGKTFFFEMAAGACQIPKSRHDRSPGFRIRNSITSAGNSLSPND